MARSNLILEFNKRSLQEKIEFFEQHGEALLSHTDGLALYQFLKTVVSDPDANSFVRKKGLELFVNALLIKKIKVRQALTLLIDDWQEDELFLELERIKALYLVYDQDPNAVTAILQFAQSSEEADLAAEACYRLGLIGFQNALTQPGPENVLAALYISKDLFGQAAVLIEKGQTEPAEKLLPIHLFLEFGASDKVLVNLMSLGLSRTSAILLKRAVSLNSEWTVDECRRYLDAVNLKRVAIPAICKAEILRLRGRAG